MLLHISTNDSVPIYQQIVNQVKYLIGSGKLRPGDVLPPIRTLSEKLVVNPNTVARAYRDLEAEGFVTCQRGVGTTVNAVGSPLSEEQRLRILSDRAGALLGDARQMNMSLAEVLELVEQCAREMGYPWEVSKK